MYEIIEEIKEEINDLITHLLNNKINTILNNYNIISYSSYVAIFYLAIFILFY